SCLRSANLLSVSICATRGWPRSTASRHPWPCFSCGYITRVRSSSWARLSRRSSPAASDRGEFSSRLKLDDCGAGAFACILRLHRPSFSSLLVRFCFRARHPRVQNFSLVLCGCGHSSERHGPRRQIDPENAISFVSVSDLDKSYGAAVPRHSEFRVNG